MNVIAAPLPSRNSTLNYWLLQLLGWGGYGAVQVYTVAVYLHVPWVRAAGEIMLLHGVAVLLTHLLRSFVRARHWEDLGAMALAPRVLVACVILAIPLSVINSSLDIVALRDPNALEVTVPSLLARPVLVMVNWVFVLVIWSSLYFVILTGRRRRLAELRQSELARALQLAELRLLKSQLNPHFLFNCLNSVRALIADNPAGAQKAVTQLARILRYTLSSGQEDQLVTLDQELGIVDDYLELESLRLGERLRIERSIPEAARSVRIPVMLLQTVVENAIKHGIAELREGGALRLEARVESNVLMLLVENPRPRLPARADSDLRTPGDGVGLKNAAERLRLLFGDASLDLNLTDPTRATTRIRIPRRAAGGMPQ